MKIWAIIENVGYDEVLIAPTVLAESLESLVNYIHHYQIKDPTIVYKELGLHPFECLLDEENCNESSWEYWSGERFVGYTWKNIKTGEIDPDYENRDDDNDDDNDWKYGDLYEIYENGELIKTIFND